PIRRSFLASLGGGGNFLLPAIQDRVTHARLPWTVSKQVAAWIPQSFEDACKRNAGRRKLHRRKREARANRISYLTKPYDFQRLIGEAQRLISANRASGYRPALA